MTPNDYLVELQRHAKELAACPAEWMPWNYRETLARRPGMSRSVIAGPVHRQAELISLRPTSKLTPKSTGKTV